MSHKEHAPSEQFQEEQGFAKDSDRNITSSLPKEVQEAINAQRTMIAWLNRFGQLSQWTGQVSQPKITIYEK